MLAVFTGGHSAPILILHLLTSHRWGSLQPGRGRWHLPICKWPVEMVVEERALCLL